MELDNKSYSVLFNYVPTDAKLRQGFIRARRRRKHHRWNRHIFSPMWEDRVLYTEYMLWDVPF